MRFIDRLDRLVAKFAIRDLMKYIMLGSFGVFIMDMVSNNLMTQLLSFSRALIMQGQIWRVITFIFIPGSGSLFVLISLFFYYYIGRMLEMAWGTTRFNTYYFMGLFFTILVGFFVGYTTTTYLNMTLFLAYATTFPESQVNIYFVLPVKVKYLGFLYAATVLFQFITAGWLVRIIILVSLLNFLVFFAPGFLKNRKRRTKTQQMRRNIESAKIASKVSTIHKCTTCGVTERDDPNMEFRYCTKCEGNYEYCEKHIRNHEHKTKVINMEDRRQI